MTLPSLSPSKPVSGGFLRHYRQSHFAPAFFFLGKKRRRALQVLYGFFRLLDDAVDSPLPGQEAPALLEAWKQALIQQKAALLEPFDHHEMGHELLAVVRHYEIPAAVLVDFIEQGVSVDLSPTPFETGMDLERYCYGVGGTVGVACLPIFGVSWQDGRDFAIRLGIAVQWTNILRDVGADISLNRLYLPLEHVERFDIRPDLLFTRSLSSTAPAFQKLMRFEAGVAQSHYDRARELMPQQWKKELLPARIMGQIYHTLLKKLDRLDFPVLERRVKLTGFEKGKATWAAVRS